MAGAADTVIGDDAGLLAELSARSLSVWATMADALPEGFRRVALAAARLLEPKAPPPAKRLGAVRALAEARIHVGVNAMPILPGLTDDPPALERLAQRAAAAGARFLYGNLLFLKPSAMQQFMPFLEREFPHLVKRYRQLYARSAYLGGEYKEQMAKLMAELRSRYGLDGPREEPPIPRRQPQLALPFGAHL